MLADHSDDIQMFDLPPPNELRGIEAYRETWPPTLCPSAVGRYRFRVTGGKLRLRVIGSDPCSDNDRTVVLKTKPWTKRS